jgi:hypothetical protein
MIRDSTLGIPKVTSQEAGTIGDIPISPPVGMPEIKDGGSGAVMDPLVASIHRRK